MSARRAVGLVAGLMLIAGCSGDDGDGDFTQSPATSDSSRDATTAAATTRAASATTTSTSSGAAPTTAETAAASTAPTTTPAIELYDGAWEVGACFDAPEDNDYTQPVPVVDCAEEHGFEIFGTGTFSSDTSEPFPGSDALAGFAQQVCGDEYVDFTGFSTDVQPIPYATFTPDENDWANGNNRVWCVVNDPGGLLTGTVASAGLDAPNLSLLYVGIVGDGVDLYVVRQGTQPVQVTDDPEEESTYPPSADGLARIYYSRYPAGDTSQADIVVFETSTKVVTPILATPADEGAPQLSPDGTRLAFHSNAASEGEFDIWVMNVDGSNPVRLTDNPERDANPRWSPDGSQIVYRASTGEASNIWVMNADGSDVHQLTDSGGDFDPVYSPDGSKIAFSSRRDGNFDIWVMNADGSDQVNVSNHPANDEYPAWFANGNRIAFTSKRLSTLVWVMNADGSQQTLFTPTGPSGYGTPLAT